MKENKKLASYSEVMYVPIILLCRWDIWVKSQQWLWSGTQQNIKEQKYGIRK